MQLCTVLALLLSPIVLELGNAVSLKKGLCHTVMDYKCGDFAQMTNYARWTDWLPSLDFWRANDNCNMTLDDYGVVSKYVPMYYDFTHGIPWFNDSTPFCVGPNEPNHMQQSNIDPNTMASYWPEFREKTIASGCQLVCPSASPCGEHCITYTAEEWFTQFFQNCPGCCDHLSTHTYVCDPDEVIKAVDSLYNLYGLPVWLTEFVCTGVYDPYVMYLFMQRILPMLENNPNVELYVWYKMRKNDDETFISNAGSLFYPDSTTLTPLGQLYESYDGGDITVDDITLHDFNEPNTPIKTLTGVDRGELLAVMKAYTIKPCDWYIVLNAILWNFGDVPASGQAFYVTKTKAEKKQRIRGFFNIIMCATQAEINDPEIYTEQQRILNLPIYPHEEKQGRLKVPAC